MAKKKKSFTITDRQFVTIQTIVELVHSNREDLLALDPMLLQLLTDHKDALVGIWIELMSQLPVSEKWEDMPFGFRCDGGRASIRTIEHLLIKWGWVKPADNTTYGYNWIAKTEWLGPLLSKMYELDYFTDAVPLTYTVMQKIVFQTFRLNPSLTSLKAHTTSLQRKKLKLIPRYLISSK